LCFLWFGRLGRGIGVDGVGLRDGVVEAVGERGGEEGGQGGEHVGLMVQWVWRTSLLARSLTMGWMGRGERWKPIGTGAMTRSG
jgi:hypothetical protein